MLYPPIQNIQQGILPCIYSNLENINSACIIRVVPSHAYSIQAVNNTNIILRNPHGDFGIAGALLEINCTQLWQFFSGLVIV